MLVHESLAPGKRCNALFGTGRLKITTKRYVYQLLYYIRNSCPSSQKFEFMGCRLHTSGLIVIIYILFTKLPWSGDREFKIFKKYNFANIRKKKIFLISKGTQIFEKLNLKKKII